MAYALRTCRRKSWNFFIKQGLLKRLSSCKLDLYEHCINRKMTKVKFGTTIHKTQGILDYVHFDVWGPSKTRSLGGRHYYVTFVDDFSRRVEAVTYVCHLVNCLPSTAIDRKTSCKNWYGKPDLEYDSLHVFGSAAYYHVKESKLNPRAKKAFFIGSPLKSKAIAYCVQRQRERSLAEIKPKRNTKRRARLNDMVVCASSIAIDDVPTTYSEAVRDLENKKWRITMSEEM
nr:Gag_pre-integrs domain-containing protein [Tanacetum cinerariifolium]